MWDISCELDEYLVGEWLVGRQVCSFNRRDLAAYTGIASFVRSPGGLRWDEHGNLQTKGVTTTVVRSYSIELGTPGTGIVRFADGTPFHELDLRRARWRARYACDADLYVGTYRVVGPFGLDIRWRVLGPGKNYVVTSRYERVTDTPHTAPN